MVAFAMRGSVCSVALLAAALLAVAPSVVVAASCAAGSFSPNGQAPCTPCALGTFQPDAGQTSCRAAQAGWSASGTGPGGSGAKAQTICKEGTFATKEGSAACTPCPAGSYCNGEGCTWPTPCPPGYFSDTPGAGQMCKACPKGTFQANHGATSCCLCCSGFYNDQTSQTHCFQCPVRGASSPAGATASKQCSSKPNGGLPTCTESSLGTCPKTGGSPTHAPAARRRNMKRDVCPGGTKSCPLYGSTSGRGFLKGYECVDVEHDLESCGGCVLNDSPFGQPAPDGGRDCSAIPFVHDVRCAGGACVVDKCRDGYVPAADKGSCVAKIEADRPTAVWRVQF
ncbi:hypothetical protein GSI_02990 [Ganoderma sinense ZZ0214-1]|uniref:Uncharacterized protein n=1 Tax=Ganoderma sinense ZZ0214-1 TaxID=1077348 RepID=A0A2G8SN67_9APHY|nr:hypothetical protein GSI_02990 [Ganoderma sinense ZZ0214-1]